MLWLESVYVVCFCLGVLMSRPSATASQSVAPPEGPVGQKGHPTLPPHGLPQRKGQKGEKGDIGIPGRHGPDGLPGLMGIHGYPGMKGGKGDLGPPGQPGESGRQGTCPQDCKNIVTQVYTESPREAESKEVRGITDSERLLSDTAILAWLLILSLLIVILMVLSLVKLRQDFSHSYKSNSRGEDTCVLYSAKGDS